MSWGSPPMLPSAGVRDLPPVPKSWKTGIADQAHLLKGSERLRGLPEVTPKSWPVSRSDPGLLGFLCSLPISLQGFTLAMTLTSSTGLCFFITCG